MTAANQKYYAHSLPGQPKEKWQELEVHLKNVAKLAEKFSTAFGEGEWGYMAGLLHDIGKYSHEFQKMLIQTANNETNMEAKIDHSSAGAQKVNELFDNGLGKLLAYAISGHHSGLLDGKANGACLERRLSKVIPNYSSCPKEILLSAPKMYCAQKLRMLPRESMNSFVSAKRPGRSMEKSATAVRFWRYVCPKLWNDRKRWPNT